MPSEHPRDFSQAAKLVVDIASGQVEDRDDAPSAAAKHGRVGAMGRIGYEGRPGSVGKRSGCSGEERARLTSMLMMSMPFISTNGCIAG